MLANENVSISLLSSDEIVTKNTLNAEQKTSNLSGVLIDTDITKKDTMLKSGIKNVSDQMVNDISSINKRTLLVIENLIDFKNEILNNVLSCKMYTTNYPLLISHIMNEAKMYHALLSKIESRKLLTKNEFYEQELFCNNIKKEHALFICGLLYPSEEKLIQTADTYAKEYKMIIENHGNNFAYLTSSSLNVF